MDCMKCIARDLSYEEWLKQARKRCEWCILRYKEVDREISRPKTKEEDEEEKAR